MLNIGYFADGKWAINCFFKILKHKNINIKFIVLRFNNPDLKLYKLAKKNKIPCFIEKDINSLYFINIINSFKPDLLVSMSFDQIFGQQIISIYNNKIINCHAGKLPQYRGRNILNWVLINDEKDFGISVHFVNDKVDDGDIIAQKIFKIKDHYNYSTLLKIAYNECANLLFNCLILFLNNNVKRYQQDLNNGFYCKKRKKGDEIINWNKSTREIFNFIRGLKGSKLSAISFIKGNKIKFFKSCEIVDYNSKIENGVITKVTKNYFIVKTNDGSLKVTNYTSDIKLKIGDKFD